MDFATPISDAVMGVLEQIPVVGIAVGIARSYDTIRDHVFEQKMRSFFTGLGSQPDEEVKAMDARCEDPKEAEAVGETLFLTLDRLNSISKCELLGVMFVAYLRRVISSEELRRLALAIDGAFEDDLKEFLIWYSPFDRQVRNDICYKNLDRAGLTKFNDPLVVRGGMTELPAIEVSPLGKALRKAYWTVRPTSEMAHFHKTISKQAES